MLQHCILSALCILIGRWILLWRIYCRYKYGLIGKLHYKYRYNQALIEYVLNIVICCVHYKLVLKSHREIKKYASVSERGSALRYFDGASSLIS